jgi:trans-2,3-dihydro-3-hydroxyanthranilate isomerase
MSERHPYVVLDVFTDRPLQGNPVAVFTEGERIDQARMQPLARELNLSETVFLLPPTREGEAEADARARIFTPRVELPFAGHPILGAAFLLAERRGLETVRLQTGAGVVPVALRDGIGEMDQPLPRWRAFPEPERLLAALGVQRSLLPVELYDNGVRHVLVALGSVEEVAALAPDLSALGRLGELGVSAFCLADAATGRVRTRMFAPALGVAEDPATGSAAGPLAVHLARHRWIAFGARIEITQGVELGRPSRLYGCAQGSGERLERVLVGGRAVRVAEGCFMLPAAGAPSSRAA